MLKIFGKEIDLDKSKILFGVPFNDESFEKHYDICKDKWTLEGDWLAGMDYGIILTKEDFYGDVLIEFESRTVPPSTHDIIFVLNAAWDSINNRHKTGYIGALEGWYEGKAGIEKAPEEIPIALTPLFDFNPGQIYHIQAGNIQGHLFIFVDGKLIIEAIDHNPIDSEKFGKVGFDAYDSHVQYRNLKILRPMWKKIEEKYEPENYLSFTEDIYL